MALTDLNGKVKKLQFADGPIGVHVATKDYYKKSTQPPSTFNIANSWSEDVAYLSGKISGNDCIDQGVDVLLAPGVNIKRSPLCGRNFEYYSEDPLLAGKLAKRFIEGVQEMKVGTSLKHFLANNREFERLTSNSEVDERTLYEIYIPAFEEALKARPYTVMCAYNMINGVFASENRKYLNDVLRNKLNFDGLIMSDWSAVHNGARAVKASLDIRMPYSKENFEEIKKGLEIGYITEEDINERAQKVLDLIEKCDVERKTDLTDEERLEGVLKIAEESIVLLKNDGVLPLKTTSVAVEGKFNLEHAYGNGSSSTEPNVTLPTLEQALSKELGVELEKSASSAPFVRPDVYHNSKTALMRAYSEDAIVIAVGTGCKVEGEGFDRDSVSLSKYDIELILNATKYSSNVIVVLYCGSAVDVSPFIDKVQAVILAGFGGQAINTAVARVLTGKVNPSGKLSETFVKTVEGTPFDLTNNINNPFNVRYSEGVFVGYRYYDTYGIDVNFPFGYGLSYSSFEYSNPVLEKIEEGEYNLSYTVKNVSEVDGAEVSEVYIKDVFSHLSRPEKELKAFSKNFIKAGEEVTVTHRLTKRDFSYYLPTVNDWYLENGDFEILIGTSSRDIKLKVKVKIELPFETQFTQFI